MVGPLHDCSVPNTDASAIPCFSRCCIGTGVRVTCLEVLWSFRFRMVLMLIVIAFAAPMSYGTLGLRRQSYTLIRVSASAWKPLIARQHP